MSRGTYDPQRAAESMRKLAAVTDAELAEQVRAAAAAVLELADVWRRGEGWPHGPMDRDAYATATAVGKALADLPGDAPLAAVVATTGPILGQWWPDRPEAAAALREAVERLRHVAMRKTSLGRDARKITRHGDWRPYEPGGRYP
ncbi:hypothetical protein [Phytohabitans kaempferiae]|uniref:DUF4254 domain-containing protein n=1 Tax=Phytohabitans kaempferiae TaxID=1620943 RepID=A0ABV6M9G9_9ACTN